MADSNTGEKIPTKEDETMFVNWVTEDNKVKVIAWPENADELEDFEKECTKEYGPGHFELFETAKRAREVAEKCGSVWNYLNRKED